MTVESSGVVNETGLAFVVFSGQTDLKWLKTLKPGFRHCFVLLETGGHWVVYNPLSNRTDITVSNSVFANCDVVYSGEVGEGSGGGLDLTTRRARVLSHRAISSRKASRSVLG